MNIFKNMILCFVLIGLVGCNKPAEPNVSMFEVGMDELIGIKVNEPFQVYGFVRNNSRYTREIAHGAGMFTYQIFDEEGNQIPYNSEFLLTNDIGYLHEMNPGEVYRNNGEDQRSKEYYEFTIDQPGKYKVKAIANFDVDYEGSRIQQEIATDLIEFIVE